MISPTGLGIRNDTEGSGYWGSKRFHGQHKGTDFLCNPFQEIVAPLDMVIVRVAKPKEGSDMSGIKWRAERMDGKMFYFLPNLDLIGHPVKKGDVIGVAQDVSIEYNDKMKPHVHFQIDSIDPVLFVELESSCKYL